MYNYLKNKNMLYIEDDIDVLNNISAVMQNYFNNVHIASNAEVGFDIYSSKSIDLLIVDIELPGINGIEFIKKIRQMNNSIPIVVISAYTNTDYLLESVELKIDKYIVKPFTSKKISTLLEKLNTIFEETDTLQLSMNISLSKSDASFIFDGNKHILTSKEYIFLEFLALQGFVNYDDFNHIWGDLAPPQDAIRSFIKQLRKKLPNDIIKNRQNIGYYV